MQSGSSKKGVDCTLSAHEVAFDQGLGEWLAALEHMQDIGAACQLSYRRALILAF